MKLEDDPIAPVVDIHDLQARARERLREDARQAWIEAELRVAVARALDMLVELEEGD
jgi:hypothetical protein